MKKRSRQQKICMIVSNDIINDSRVLKEADSLSKAGYDVSVLGVHNSGLELLETIDGFNIKRVVVRTRSLKSKILLPLKAIEYLILTLIEALRINADVYHCHDISPMLVAWLASRIRRAKLIYDSHELEYDRNLSKHLRLFSRVYERLFINKVDHIIVSDGKYRAQAMVKNNNCRIPMTYVMNCPPKITLDIRDRKKIREELGVSEQEKLILYIGHFFSGRGLRNILDSLSRLHDVVLVIMGKRYDSEISYWENEFRVKDRVRFIGPFHYSEVIKIASGADLGLVLIENTCLSYFYSTPTKLFDYIAASLPILASNFPAMEDIVLYSPAGPIGVCVDPASPKDITQAMRQILNDDTGHYGNFKKIARELHINKFNWEYQESKLFNVYQSLKENKQ